MADDDAERLAALRRFGILDTAPEVRFDDLVRLAASICGTPMAAVSLVDEDRQWFKARLGLDVDQTPISDALCAHTIDQREVLEVPDARQDPRFAGSGLVVGPPHLAFYAAAPLVTPEDHAIGTVCVLDCEPRRLDETQRQALRVLADQAMALVLLHQQALLTQRLEARFRALVERSTDLILLVDADGSFRYISPAAREILGHEPDARGLTGLGDVVLEPDVREVLEVALAAPSGSPFTLPEARLRRQDGSVVVLDVRGTNLLDDPAVEAIVLNARDITERRALEDRLAHGALHDELTGLPNRQLLRDRLAGALARVARDGCQVGVLFCDLDRFKVVNDSSGHSVGDEVLVQVADRLASTVRSTDTVVRFGGDEFVVVVDGVDDAVEVADLADRVRSALLAPVVVHGHEVPTSVSIGYVVAGGGADPERLVSDADAAMYLAKERGRNRIEPFGSELHARVLTRLDEERALRRALDDGELVLHYQPIVDLPAGRTTGAEALVRWDRPGHGLVLPTSFIAMAEETGLIVELGDWVLDTALAQLRRWREAHPEADPSVAVNVSARQLGSGNLAATVADAIDRHGVDPWAVTLELTESTLMGDVDRSTRTLEALRDTGVTIAIDDFGTGYSSLAYLKSLPIDTLKIDRSFVVNVGRDPYDTAIVRAVASIGRVLDLRVVAEGVETADQAAQVLALGCARAQGHHFGVAVPGPALAARFAPGGEATPRIS